jgi:hypothetical protein
MARRTFLSCTLQHKIVPLLRFIDLRHVTLHITNDPIRVELPQGWTPTFPPMSIATWTRAVGPVGNVWILRGNSTGSVYSTFTHTFGYVVTMLLEVATP